MLFSLLLSLSPCLLTSLACKRECVCVCSVSLFFSLARSHLPYFVIRFHFVFIHIRLFHTLRFALFFGVNVISRVAAAAGAAVAAAAALPRQSSQLFAFVLLLLLFLLLPLLLLLFFFCACLVFLLRRVYYVYAATVIMMSSRIARINVIFTFCTCVSVCVCVRYVTLVSERLCCRCTF